MSDPKRYAFKVNEENDFDLIEHSEGEYVRYEDYARLKAEVERLTSENESLQAKATNIYNAMVVRCKVEEITHKANADSIISQGMMSEAMKMIEESVAIREQVERLTKAGDKAFSLWSSGDESDADNFKEAIWAWTIAKKGGQP